MSELSNREWKELEKLKQKSSYTKLSQPEQRRLEKLEGIHSNQQKQVEKDKWSNDRSLKAQQLELKPMNKHQADFIAAMDNCIISVGTGSAGTGKTYLACRYAAKELLSGNIRKIIIARPYVALAGRDIGFRPNSELEKLRSFVRPMLGYLSDVLGAAMVEQQVSTEGGKIQLQALDAIRGMSYDNAIILIDEASNLTVAEVQAITTRLGKNCRLILTGDNSQSDTQHNGLRWFEDLVKKHYIQDVGVVRFNHDDIVRSGMVKQLVIAFEREGGYLK